MSTFKLPSARQRKLLAKAQTVYQKDLSLAAGFLSARGISILDATEWGFGVVNSPEPSHERMTGMLCIPYYNMKGIIALKFRCMGDHDCKAEGHRKYDQPDNQTQFLYNLPALEKHERTAHVCEGELDARILGKVMASRVVHAVLAEPVVGVPGVDVWQAHWPAHFHGFERVVIWPDGDKAGRAMANTWSRKIGAEVVPMPTGQDVTSIYLESGAKGLLELYEGDSDGELVRED